MKALGTRFYSGNCNIMATAVKPKALLLLQVSGGGHGGGPEHAGGSAHGPGALRRAGPEEVAVRRVVQRRDAGQHDGGWRSAWVSSAAVLLLVCMH